MQMNRMTATCLFVLLSCAVCTARAEKPQAISHQLFLREVMALAEPSTASGQRLSDDQVGQLKKLESEFRAARRGAVAAAGKERNAAQEDVTKAVDKKTADMKDFDAKLESHRAELEKLRAELEATKPGSPERKAVRAKVDAKKAEVDTMKAQKDGARDRLTEEIEDARKAKENTAKDRAGAPGTPAVLDAAAYETKVRAVLNPEQIKALDERLEAARRALERIDALESID